MNLNHLRYFLTVASTGSFSRAAGQEGVTQPTVSSGVMELERALGVKLFNRGSRQVALTMEGRELVNYAMQIQDLVAEAEDRLKRGEVLPGERFQFGATDAVVTYLLPEILRGYTREYPGVELSVHVAPSKSLVDDVLMGRSEFALVTLPVSHSALQTLQIYRDSMPLVVGPTHPLADSGSVSLTEVMEHPLILFQADSVSRKILDEGFAEAGVSPGVMMEMGSPEAMRKLVEAGVGISFLPFLTVEESVKTGALKVVDVKGMNFNREVGVAWRFKRYFSPAVRYLMEAIFDRYGGKEAWMI